MSDVMSGKMSKYEALVAASFDGRGGLVRAREWDGSHKTGRAFHFEHAPSRLVARLLIDPIAQSVSLEARRYAERPAAGPDAVHWPYGRDLPDGAVLLAAGSWVKEEDLARKIRALVSNLCEHFRLLEWKPGPQAAAFLDAFRTDPLEVERCRQLLPDVLWLELRHLDPSQPRSIRLPLGYSLHVHEAEGFSSTLGLVPPHRHLSLDLARYPEPATFPAAQPFGCQLSPPELRRTTEQWLREGVQIAEREGAWPLLPAGVTYLGDQRPGLELQRGPRLEPSRALVVALNRQTPRFAAFAQLVDGLGEAEWRSVYEGTVARADPLQTVREQVDRQPQDFAGYKKLAEVYASRGAGAQANLWLGLGYLRAHRLPQLARSKLELARKENPNLDGLAAAFRELEAPR